MSCKYQFLFCTKYKKEILTDDVKESLTGLIFTKCSEKDIKVIDLDIEPFYVEMKIECSPSYSPLEIVKSIKHQTAIQLKREFPFINKLLPGLWTRNVLITSMGNELRDKEKNKFIDGELFKYETR